MKLKIPWKMLSNGLPKKLLWLTKTWDPLELIFWMLFSTPMPSTEEEVNSFLLPEEFIMLVNLLLNLVFKNPSS